LLSPYRTAKDIGNETETLGATALPAEISINSNVSLPLYPEVGVVALTTDPWRVEWMHPRHHVLSRLAQYFQVVWMEPSQEWRAVLRREKPTTPIFDRVPDNPGMTVYRQEFPLPHFFRLKKLARVTLRARVRRAASYLRRQGCRKIVLYLWNPRFGPALDACRWDLTCYHIDDEYSYSAVEAPNPPEEVEVLKRVDQVFIHSETLMEKKGHINPNSMLIPNGVNYSWFATPVPEPEDLANVPHPRVGYVGFLKRQLNWELLRTLPVRHPEWSFVFVGGVVEHPEIVPILREMAARKNVFFLGSKHAQVAAIYPQHFDVCIMPYAMNDYTKYIYPLKLHEYLATGQPIVSMPLPAVKRFAQYVALAETEEEWSAALTASLLPKQSEQIRREARQAVAREHDWDVLVGRVAKCFAERLRLREVEAVAGAEVLGQ
jgi:glycosyltransferase involved in cell wall biosynthesis